MKKTHTILVPNMLPIHFHLIIKILEHQEIDEMTVMMYSTNAAQAEEGK